MRRAVLVALVAAAAPAAADDTAPARVTATLHGTTARFAIHVTVHTDSEAFPTATLVVDLPSHGLVTAATLAAAGATHRLALTPAGPANDAFWALANGSGASAAWGALITASGDAASIELAAPGRQTVALDLEVEAPTCFEHDQRYVEVPATWRGLVATTAAPQACEGRGDGAWMTFRAPAPDRIGSLAGRLPLSTSDVARVELDLARELADVPADLHTAIVIDASRSLTDDEREEQRAIVASYLHAVPHTFVQLVGYTRAGAPLLPSWAATDTAAARVDRQLRALRPGNGSNADAGLAEAGAWLGRVTGTRRVLLFTDERVARRLEASDGTAFASSLPAGTLVHVIALGGASGELSRDDHVLFGGLATATGGIGVRGALADRIDATLLARPISLDGLELHGAGWTELSADRCDADHLAAGTSCTWWAHGDASAGPITVTGSLWSTRFSRVVRPDPTRARALARELSATGALDSALQAEVDRAALAVNAVWSLFATWGGTGGYTEHMGFGTLSGTAGSHDTGTIVDTLGVAQAIPHVDLRAQLAGPLSACGAVHATIAIELTREEIVDVKVDGATGALRTCLEDAVWNTLVALPGAPPVSRATITL